MVDPDGGAIATLRREVARNATRARNGVKLVAGAEFAPRHPTPSDVIWTNGKARVRRFRRDSPARYATPIVLYLGLVGQPYVFDLYKGGSIAQMLMDRGFDVYILDWGVPTELDVHNTLETYLGGYLPKALEAICNESGAPDVNAMGYCMGGVMSIHALAAQPDLPINSLVTLAAPFDWSDMGAQTNAIRDGKLTLDDLADTNGNLPASVIVESFKVRKPTSDLVNYANLWQNLWNDQYVEGYQAIGRFLRDHIPVARAAAEQIVAHWMRENAFMTDRLRFDGRPVSLADIRTPVLGVIAERDDIAPLASATAIGDILPNASVEKLQIDTGHVSLFAGRQAVKIVMPQIFDWIADHSEETT
ncbi:MAG: alpha/beta fold hydrolase [Acidimicrobiales bacterium]